MKHLALATLGDLMHVLRASCNYWNVTPIQVKKKYLDLVPPMSVFSVHGSYDNNYVAIHNHENVLYQTTHSMQMTVTTSVVTLVSRGNGWS